MHCGIPCLLEKTDLEKSGLFNQRDEDLLEIVRDDVYRKELSPIRIEFNSVLFVNISSSTCWKHSLPIERKVRSANHPKSNTAMISSFKKPEGIIICVMLDTTGLEGEMNNSCIKKLFK